MKHNVLGIIPARGGSKGVPRKNIKLLNGKPLLAYTIESVNKARLLDKCVVSTEDDEIAGVAKKYGAEVVRRPPELARDDSPTYDAVKQVLEHFEKIGQVYDIVVLLQVTSPLRKDDDIDNAIKLFLDNYDKCDALTSLGEIQTEHPLLSRVVTNGYVTPFVLSDKNNSRRQELPKIYFPYGVIHIAKVDTLIKTKTFYPERTLPYFIENWQNYEIDSIYDFCCTEAIMKAKNSGQLD